MSKWFWNALEWISRVETIHGLLTTEFVRTALWPTISAVLTGTAGVIGGVPIMWVLMASALTFMAVTQALLRADELRERKNPQNKLSHKVVFQCDLNTAQMPLFGNRHQRRTQGTRKEPRQELSSTQLSPQVPRTIEKGQLGIDITNNASFPISCILTMATSDLEGEEPPRTTYPKAAVIVPAKGAIRLSDEAIDLDNMPCQRLAGNLDMLIKYGLPGKENYDLRVKGAITVVMEGFGLVSAVIMSLNDKPITPAD